MQCKYNHIYKEYQIPPYINLITFFSTQPPIVPRIAHAGDTHCFDDYDEGDWKQAETCSPEDLVCFDDF